VLSLVFWAIVLVVAIKYVVFVMRALRTVQELIQWLSASPRPLVTYSTIAFRRRAMALKIVGVEGPRLSEDEDGATQDFVLANGPAFTSATAKKFLGSLKLLAATTDKQRAQRRSPRLCREAWRQYLRRSVTRALQ
jgi:hypothetical protein